MKTCLLVVIYACLATFSFNASATIVNVPPTIVDYGDYLSDTDTGLDWLDLTKTAGRSYDDVSAEIVSGEFQGWRYATISEVSTLWTNFGGNDAYYNGWSTNNNGLFDVIAPLMGDLQCPNPDPGCDTGGDGFTHWITADIATLADANNKPWAITADQHLHAVLFDYYVNTAEAPTQDFVNLKQLTEADDFAGPGHGSALVRASIVTSPIPVPASLWLFGSGLLGLVGMAKRKKRRKS